MRLKESEIGSSCLQDRSFTSGIISLALVFISFIPIHIVLSWSANMYVMLALFVPFCSSMFLYAYCRKLHLVFVHETLQVTRNLSFIHFKRLLFPHNFITFIYYVSMYLNSLYPLKNEIYSILLYVSYFLFYLVNDIE